MGSLSMYSDIYSDSAFIKQPGFALLKHMEDEMFQSCRTNDL